MAENWPSPKDPDEIRDYGIDWSADLNGSTISASTWTVVSGTVSITSSTHDTTTTTVRFSGGTVGETCQVLNHVTLANGEVCEQTGRLSIQAK